MSEKRLSRLPRLESLISKIEQNPDYHFHFKVTDDYFKDIIPDYTTLAAFRRDYGRFSAPVVERILANDQHFARIFPDINNLIKFLSNTRDWTSYHGAVLERVLSNKADFARIFLTADSLVAVAEVAPTYKGRLMARYPEVAKVERTRASIEWARSDAASSSSFFGASRRDNIGQSNGHGQQSSANPFQAKKL